MTQNFLTLGWWNLVGLQGWLSRLSKLHHVAHLWWVLMFDIFFIGHNSSLLWNVTSRTLPRGGICWEIFVRGTGDLPRQGLCIPRPDILSVNCLWLIIGWYQGAFVHWSEVSRLGDVLNSQISSQRDNTDDKYFFTGVVYQEMFLRLAMWQNQYFRAIEEKNEICRWYGTQK